MIFFLSVAFAKPLPAWVEDKRFQGFVELADAPDLSSLTPEVRPGHMAHTLGTKVVLTPLEGTTAEQILERVKAEEATISAQIVEGRVEVEHPDPLSMLALSMGEPTLGDRVLLEESIDRKATRAVLAIENIASARAEVSIEGVHIGRIGPYTTAVVSDLPAGRYLISFELPNGYVREAILTTQETAEPTMKLRMR